MFEIVVIALVVIITVIAHVWLYRWVKFKMDEGVLLKHLQDCLAAGELLLSTKQLASATRLADGRVVHVCERSLKISRQQPHHWALQK